MAVLVNSVDVSADPEAVFDYASNLENELEWNRGRVTYVERLTKGPIGVGTRYRARWPGSSETIVEYRSFDRPRSWSAFGTTRGFDMVVSGEVSPTPGGTHLTATMDLRPKGLLRPLSPLVRLWMQRIEARNLANFKRVMEGKQRRAPVADLG